MSHCSKGRGQYARRALVFIKPHKFKVALILSLTLLVAALGALEPLVLKYFFDQLDTKAGEALAAGVLMLIVLGLAREAIGGASNWLMWKVRLRINSDLLDSTVSRLHHLPIDYHREETVGGIMTKLDKGINGLVGALSELAFNVFPGVVYLVISLFIMVKLDWRLSLIVLFFAPAPAIIGMWASKEQAERERTLTNRWTRIFSRFNEVLTGIITVKSFATEDEEKRRFMDDVVKTNSLVLRGIAVDTSVGAAKNTVALVARVTALMAGGYLAMGGEITAGTLVAFLGYAGGLFGPVQGLTGIYQTLRKATVSLEIVFSILDADDHLNDSPDAQHVRAVKGEVRFNNVSFSYGKHGRPLLTGVNLAVDPGEVVAIVGPSGAGKSTMMALLQRLHDPTSGSILVDGVDLKELKQRSLRRHIGFVSQDALLFNDTVRNNIAYGRVESTESEIIEAAMAANAHNFIMRLPNGYDSFIGERGSLLSSGERQRISIARALVKNPPILVLDEATSALDAESESLVQDALTRLMEGRTTFIIAHRLSTVVGADRILVIKDGQIAETGTHETLLKAGGYYSSLVAHQTRGLLIEAA